MKRHIKVFHPETLAETVHETKKENEESDNIAMALSVQEEASSDEETPNNEKPSDDESSLAKKMNDLNELLDELVKSEELYERLHCMKCNFVTSAKRKKVRID